MDTKTKSKDKKPVLQVVDRGKPSIYDTDWLKPAKKFPPARNIPGCGTKTTERMQQTF